MREKRSSTFQGALRPSRLTPTVEVVPDLKVVLLGSENAGKINVLLASYALANDSQVPPSKSTDFLGEEKMGFSIPLTHDGRRYRLSVIDSSSCDQFRAVRDMQIRMGDCFLLVYCSSSWTSFREIEKLCRDIATAKESEVPIVLVSNNIDEEEEELRKEKLRKKSKRTASNSGDRKERRLSDTIEVISSGDSASEHKLGEKEEPQGPKRVPREEGEKLALKLNCRFFELGSSTPSSPSSSSSPRPYPQTTLSPSTPASITQISTPLSGYAPVLKEAYLYLLASYVSLSKKERKTCAVM